MPDIKPNATKRLSHAAKEGEVNNIYFGIVSAVHI